MNWYYRRGDDQYGPFSMPTLKLLASSGTLLATDWILPANGDTWTPAGKHPGLFSAIVAVEGATLAPPPVAVVTVETGSALALRAISRPSVAWVAAAIMALVAAYFVFRGPEDDWKPTGNGVTIVNTRTGEIRLASTGQTVAEYDKELEEHAARERMEQSVRDAATASKRKEESAAQLQRRVDQLVHNQAIYARVKQFVEKYPRLKTVGGIDSFYVHAMRCFRTGLLPSNAEVDEILDQLGNAASMPEYAGNSELRSAIAEMQKWRRW